ncbi:MAG: LptF/LptG family permease, partial [Acidobacteriota bacterium]|nr:LptF/LptG family permease [Acidobacteriota bacterium]
DRWIRTKGWRIVPWLRRHFGLRRVRRVRPALDAATPPSTRGAKDLVLRLPSRRRRLVSRLDRYVIQRFFAAFALILLSALAVYLIADLTEKADDFVKNDVPAEVITDYYKYVSFQNTYDLAPLVVLITTLAVFGLLSRNNEVIAAKASGISVYRLAVPALLASLVIVGFLGFLETKVLPSSNQRVTALLDQIQGRKVVRSFRRADRNWLYGQGRYIYNYLHYDPDEQALHRLQVFEFDENDRLIKRLFARKATYVGDGWLFEESWTRTFDGRETVDYQPYDKPVLGYFPETPTYFESEVRQPEALSYRELSEHIEEIESSGQSVPKLRVALAKKIGFPAICFVMALVALPYSFRLGRRGALYGVGVGIILGIVFLASYAFSTMLGETGSLPPPVAVWSPSIAFILFALYGFLGVET